MSRTRPTFCLVFLVSLLWFPSLCRADGPKIKALIEYVKVSQKIACPFTAGESAFVALSDKTIQLQQKSKSVQNDLNDFGTPEDRELLERLQKWSDAVKDAKAGVGNDASMIAGLVLIFASALFVDAWWCKLPWKALRTPIHTVGKVAICGCSGAQASAVGVEKK